VEGQKAAMSGIPTHFFFYPFDGGSLYMESQLQRLSEFLGGIKCPVNFKEIRELKKQGKILDKKRCCGKLSSSEAFKILISFSDLAGDLAGFSRMISSLEETDIDLRNRIALISASDIRIFMKSNSLGPHIVFDELPHEFPMTWGTIIVKWHNY
jgi:hypothetical protein